MCDVTGTRNLTPKKGWKVVAVHKKTGEYYSPAMGMKYKSGRVVPSLKVQNKISDWYNNEILDTMQYHKTIAEAKKSVSIQSGFRAAMIGRTGIFVLKKDAYSYLSKLEQSTIKPGYVLKVVKAEVSNKVRTGVVQHSLGSFKYAVYTGKVITFI